VEFFVFALTAALAVSHSTLAPLVGQFAATEILDGARIELLQPYRPARFA
jgi:hypothetical protein